MHAATSEGTTDIEVGFYDSRTIFELLEAADRDWHIYYDDTPEVWAFRKLWDDQRKTNWFRSSTFADHVAAGKLPAYSFIEPNQRPPIHLDPYTPVVGLHDHPDSQHPGNNLIADDEYDAAPVSGPGDFARGEALLAEIYEALRANPEVFERSVLLITYDEHGGTYDHVPPPTDVPPPGGPPGVGVLWHLVHWALRRRAKAFDFRMLGVRVPAVVVSPWIPVASVDTTVRDHASIPATVRALFAPHAPPLTARDAWSPRFDQMLTLDQPRTDLPDLSAYLIPPPPPDATPGPLTLDEPPLPAHYDDLDELATRGRPPTPRPQPARRPGAAWPRHQGHPGVPGLDRTATGHDLSVTAAMVAWCRSADVSVHVVLDGGQGFGVAQGPTEQVAVGPGQLLGRGMATDGVDRGLGHLDGGRRLRGQLLGGGGHPRIEVVGRPDLVHEPDGERLGGAHVAPGQQELAGSRGAELTHHAGDAAPGQGDAHGDLRDGDPHVVAGDADVAGQSQQGTPADDRTVEGDHRGLGKRFELVEHPRPSAGRSTTLGPRGQQLLVAFADVGSGAEAGSFAAQHDGPGVGIVGDAAQGGLQFHGGPRAQRVSPLGSIEHDRPHRTLVLERHDRRVGVGAAHRSTLMGAGSRRFLRRIRGSKSARSTGAMPSSRSWIGVAPYSPS